MAEVEAFAALLQDVPAGPRFASVKIDGANLERVLSSRDGTFIVNRIRGALGSSRFSDQSDSATGFRQICSGSHD